VRASRARRGELPGGAANVSELLALSKGGAADYNEAGPRQQLQHYLARATNYRDPETGMQAKVRGVGFGENNRGAMMVTYDIVDAQGRTVGEAQRIWKTGPGGVQVKHQYLNLTKRVQGGGFAARWNRQVEDVYRANGVKEVVLDANVDVGGYAWAKQGYDFETAEAMISLKAQVSNRLRGRRRTSNYLDDYVYPNREVADMRTVADAPPLTPQQQARLDQLKERSTLEDWEAGTAPTPLEWAMWGWTPGATDWPGKRFMLGTSWQGIKEL
jgi:hypothetical protein